MSENDPMSAWGKKVAEGRAAEVFEAGPGRVARVARGPADYFREAAVMDRARREGVPVPVVYDVDDGVMVMERIDGPTMAADLQARPWRLARHARTLAGLQGQINTIAPGASPLAPGPIPGHHLLHLDLHPENVMLSPAGPVVIDWANAAVGDPAADVAMTWIIMGSSELRMPWWGRTIVGALRQRFIATWLDHSDRQGARRALTAVGEARIGDPNVTPDEVERIRALVRRWATD